MLTVLVVNNSGSGRCSGKYTRTILHLMNKTLLATFAIVLSLSLAACTLPAVTALPTKTVRPTSSPISKQPLPTPTKVPTPTTKPVCLEKKGSIDSGELVDASLDKPIRYLVYLPPCYGFVLNESHMYPVLFLLHGQNNDEQQWLRIGATDAADALIEAKQVPPFIIVFPFDYAIKQPNQYNYEEVFVNRLVPLIDQNYRVRPGKENHAIGGLSRGGAWALHLGIRHPQVFGVIGGHSPVIFFADHSNLPASLLIIPTDQIPRIWLDIGNSDPELRLMRQFEQFLTNNQVPHAWNVFEGYHEEKYWSAHVSEYLQWYANAWAGR